MRCQQSFCPSPSPVFLWSFAGCFLALGPTSPPMWWASHCLCFPLFLSQISPGNGVVSSHPLSPSDIFCLHFDSSFTQPQQRSKTIEVLGVHRSYGSGGRRGPSGTVGDKAGVSAPSLWGPMMGRVVLNALAASLFSCLPLQPRERQFGKRKLQQ